MEEGTNNQTMGTKEIETMILLEGAIRIIRTMETPSDLLVDSRRMEDPKDSFTGKTKEMEVNTMDPENKTIVEISKEPMIRTNTGTTTEVPRVYRCQTW